MTLAESNKAPQTAAMLRGGNRSRYSEGAVENTPSGTRTSLGRGLDALFVGGGVRVKIRGIIFSPSPNLLFPLHPA